jgi:xanthine/uracil permease
MNKEIALFFAFAAGIIAVTLGVFGASLPVMLGISLATVGPLMVIFVARGDGGTAGRRGRRR